MTSREKGWLELVAEEWELNPDECWRAMYMATYEALISAGGMFGVDASRVALRTARQAALRFLGSMSQIEAARVLTISRRQAGYANRGAAARAMARLP